MFASLRLYLGSIYLYTLITGAAMEVFKGLVLLDIRLATANAVDIATIIAVYKSDIVHLFSFVVQLS